MDDHHFSLEILNRTGPLEPVCAQKIGEDLAVIQKTIEATASKVPQHAKGERENIKQRTPENVRLREEAAARCTKQIKSGQETSQESKGGAPGEIVA